MAQNTNTITVTGNLTRDPELRYTPNGGAVANFGLAVNRSWQNRQTNEWEEAVSFFDVTVWQDQAEHIAQSLAKGDRAIVSGRLEQRSWEQNGEKRYKIEIVADEVGASFKYATAAVTRTERRGGAPAPSGPDDYGQRSSSSGGQQRRSQPQQQAPQQQAPQQQAPAQSYQGGGYDDEEPF